MLDLYPLAKPLLFGLDAEAAHDVTMRGLCAPGAALALRLATGGTVTDPISLLGMEFPNRIGLAAGLDKNAAHIDQLAAMGFGFIEVGTVTPKAQPGNPKPRLFRLPEHDALINRFGFNNVGLTEFLKNVSKSTWWAKKRGVLGLNIGKNAATPIENALDDYLIGLKAVYAQAGYVTVNVSSPNTKNLRQLQAASELDALLGGLRSEQLALADQYQRYVPVLLKIAPDLDDEQLDAIAHALKKHAIDGVIASNTTLSRTAVQGAQHADEAGGLSGAPVRELSNAVIKALRSRLGKKYPIIGVGGVLSAAHAQEKIAAGANLVQIYTGLIYKGPRLVRDCAEHIRLHR
jgi:dihydroorotate dehydrogenase